MVINKVEKIIFGLLKNEGVIMLPHTSGVCVFRGNGSRSQYFTHKKAKRMMEQVREISMQEYIDQFTPIKFENEYIRLMRKSGLNTEEKERLLMLVKILRFFIDNAPFPNLYFGLNEDALCLEVKNNILSLCISPLRNDSTFFKSYSNFVYISQRQFEDLLKGNKEAMREKQYSPGEILRMSFRFYNLLGNLPHEGRENDLERECFEKIVPSDIKIEEGTQEDNKMLEKYYNDLTQRFPPRKWWQFWK